MSSSLVLPEESAARRVRVTLGFELLLALLSAFGPLSTDMYLPAMPTMASALDTDAGGVGATLASYFLGMGVGQLVAGPVLDRFGRLPPLRFGLLLYIASCLGCAFAPGIGILVAARALQGLGGAIVLVVPRAVVRDLRSGAEAARMLSQLAMIGAAAPVVAPLLGGLVFTALGWRWVFGTLALIAAFALFVTWRFLPETAPAPTRGVSLGGHLVALARDRAFVFYSLAIAASGGALFAYIGSSSFVLIELHGVAPHHFGWVFGMNALGFLLAARLNRAHLLRLPPIRILAFGNIAGVAIGAVVLAVSATNAGGPWGIALAMCSFSVTLGLVMPNATALAFENHRDRAGLAAAVQGALHAAGTAAGSWAVGAAADGTALPTGLGVVSFALLSALLAFTAAHRAPSTALPQTHAAAHRPEKPSSECP